MKLYPGVFLALQMGHPHDSSVLFAYMLERLFTCWLRKIDITTVLLLCLLITHQESCVQVYWEIIQ